MQGVTTLQIFCEQAWRDAASLRVADIQGGVATPMEVSYELDYALAFAGCTDSAALSYTQPVTLEAYRHGVWPAYLVDCLPQGFGRLELLRQLGLPERSEALADWALLVHGAGNPIGNMRVKEAFAYLQTRAGAQSMSHEGFSFDEVAQRGEAFTEYLASHGLFVAGSSGVQGEWPKILLTEDAHGRLHLDHDLPDSEARRHWLVKFARGQDKALEKILRLEPAWMTLAKHLGLHTQGIVHLHGRALFVERFDRQAVVDQRGAVQVLRHSQESLYALCGVGGFAGKLSHNEAVTQLAKAAVDPLETVIEYLRRDVANLALGNKDNHGRNTAVSRLAKSVVLTPVFDFCPMYLHPDGIARRMRWMDAMGYPDSASPDWAWVCERAAQAARASPEQIRDALKATAEQVATLPREMKALDVDPDVIAFLKPAIEQQAIALSRL